MLRNRDYTDDVIWTLDDCDDAEQDLVELMSAPLRASDTAPRPMLARSGEVPVMTEEQALMLRRISAA